ncbi:MAG: hypothetical protein BJ554DRAFT_5648, partial [Olpidium bornovanus]
SRSSAGYDLGKVAAAARAGVAAAALLGRGSLLGRLRLLVLALFALVYLALCSSALGRWFAALRTSLKAPSWNVDFVPGERSLLDRAKGRNGSRPVPADPPAGRARGEPISQAAHYADMIDNFEEEQPVLNLNDPTHRELLERLSAYRVDMFLDKARRPLYDPDPNPAAVRKARFVPRRSRRSLRTVLTSSGWNRFSCHQQIAIGDFPWVGTSLTPREKQKSKPPRLLGSILGPMPNPWDVYPNPSTLDTIASVPDVSSSRYEAKEDAPEPGQSLGPLQLITSQLAKYPFFREIVIWNNDPTVEISGQVSGTCRYYHGWLLIAGIGVHRRWTFTSSDYLHAGFASLDRGSFAPKSAVNRFLKQAGWAGLPREQLNHADAYFTIWTNQYPVQLEVPLVSLKRRSTVESASRDLEYAVSWRGEQDRKFFKFFFLAVREEYWAE